MSMNKPTERIEEFVPHVDDPMLSLAECGRLVGRSGETIRKWVEQGFLTTVRDPSNLRRVRKSHLLAFYKGTALQEKRPIIEE